jgi:hypothetical protein
MDPCLAGFTSGWFHFLALSIRRVACRHPTEVGPIPRQCRRGSIAVCD